MGEVKKSPEGRVTSRRIPKSKCSSTISSSSDIEPPNKFKRRAIGAGNPGGTATKPMGREEADLLGDVEFNAFIRASGKELVDGMESLARKAETVSEEDVTKYAGVIDSVHHKPCYVKLIVALFKMMEDLFDDGGDTPADVEPFRVELLDDSRTVTEPYRRIRGDWKRNIQEQLLDMEEKGII
ncbi:hypothetical protein ADUPG1_005702, partial [Aduncisulcus paluster]